MSSRANVTNALLLLLGVLLVALSHHLTVEFDHFVIGYSETTILAISVFAAACLAVTQLPVDRRTLPLILVISALCHLALLTPEPYLSSDIYRYVWDGMVQHHGISPYRYVPGNPQLAFMRDDDIFPNINRRDYAPTIYPPLAQMIFYAATYFSPTVVGMRLVMYAFEALAIWALLRLLPGMGLRREQVLLFAWCPLLLWEIGSSGHLDAVAIGLMALALLFRLRDQPWLCGLALGGAVMTKFYPLVLLPALWQRRYGLRQLWALLAVVLGGYAVYARVGRRVFGFASGYADEEGLSSGSRYFVYAWTRHLPGLAGLPIAAFFLLCAAVAAALLWWCWQHRDDPPGSTLFVSRAMLTAWLMMLLFSPHYPWYVAWLVLFLSLLPVLPLLVYVGLIFWGFTTRFAMPGPLMFQLNTWIYGYTLLAVVVYLLLRGRMDALRRTLRWPVEAAD